MSPPQKWSSLQNLIKKQMLKLRGNAGAQARSTYPTSDTQLSKGKYMEYGSLIRKEKHRRPLPIYSPINLRLGDLRGIYGRDKSRGRVPWGSHTETGATPAQDKANQ